MQNTIMNMRPDEQICLQLRRLYETRGFRRVRPGKFEEHALYIQNKNFLQSEHMISFMDMDGKLLALKPDVTLSVVKNIPNKSLPTFQKLYYIDEVYRASVENREYRAHSQIGVELVGPSDVFADIEIVDLALLSLQSIGENYVLDISHQRFVSGLMAQIGIPYSAEQQVFSAIHSKSNHEMHHILAELQISAEDQARLLALCEIHGEIAAVLPQVEKLIVGEEMRTAYQELQTIATTLGNNGFRERLRLDFSVVNDLDYYNGLIFRGYVEGISRSILTGGRYDNLLHKMGKQSGAAGFAISVDELSSYTHLEHRYDFDAVIVYPDHADYSALLQQVKTSTAAGMRVRLERADADLSLADFTWEHLYHFLDGKLVKIEEGADKSCKIQGLC